MREPPDAPHLRATQEFLSAAFQRSASVASDPGLAEACTAHVRGNERLSAAEQVDIYREQFWARHRDSLLEDFPGVHYLLGNQGFDAFCRAYLGEHPPRTPSLRELGADLARFAERYEGFPPALRAIARDMVRYELAFVDVFDGPEYAPLDPAKLAALPEGAIERARVVFHPLIQQMRLDYPVHRVRYAVKADEVVPELEPLPARVVLFRVEAVLRYEELSERAFALLLALREGVSLGPACERVAAGLGDADAEALAGEVGAWFQQWAAWGWIVDLQVEGGP